MPGAPPRPTGRLVAADDLEVDLCLQQEINSAVDALGKVADRVPGGRVQRGEVAPIIQVVLDTAMMGADPLEDPWHQLDHANARRPAVMNQPSGMGKKRSNASNASSAVGISPAGMPEYFDIHSNSCSSRSSR